MGSFFSIEPSSVEVVAGSISQFSFTLCYDAREKKRINQPLDLGPEDFPTLSELSNPSACVKKRGTACFYIVFRCGNRSDEIGTGEDLQQASISIVGGRSSGWIIAPRVFGQMPYWTLYPVAQEEVDNSEQGAFKVNVNNLRVNNQEGITSMFIKFYSGSQTRDDTTLRIDKINWLYVSNITVSKSNGWRERERIYICVKGDQKFVSRTGFELWDKEKSTTVYPNQWNYLDFSVLGNRNLYLRVQDAVIYKKISYQIPFFKYQLEGKKDTLSLSWAMCTAEGYSDYKLDNHSVDAENTKEYQLGKENKFCSSLKVLYTGESQKKTEFEYRLEGMPLPRIVSFDIYFQDIAPANSGFMDPELLKQPGIVLQVPPYEPFVPVPVPVPKRKVSVSWKVKDADVVTIDGQKVNGNEGRQTFETGNSAMTIQAKLDNGFFREQTQKIKGGS